MPLFFFLVGWGCMSWDCLIESVYLCMSCSSLVVSKKNTVGRLWHVHPIRLAVSFPKRVWNDFCWLPLPRIVHWLICSLYKTPFLVSFRGFEAILGDHLQQGSASRIFNIKHWCDQHWLNTKTTLRAFGVLKVPNVYVFSTRKQCFFKKGFCWVTDCWLRKIRFSLIEKTFP